MNIQVNTFEKKENRYFEDILKNYNFCKNDALQLEAIGSVVEKYEDELLKEFYKFIFNFNHAKSFLHNEEILTRHQIGIRKWFKNLFCGNYNANYFHKLNIISEVHVNIGLPTNYVNAAFSFVRRFIKEKLIDDNLCAALISFDKIIDINLDILTITYREEEQAKLIDDVVFLKSVVEQENIEPYIQAIVNSKTGKIEKYECLMRLIDPKSLEVKSVFKYLDISKKIKLYEKMMRLMIEKSMDYFSNKDIEFSLNLSYSDISNEEFRDFIYKKIEEFPKSENIIFEILETDIIEDFSIVKKFIKKIKSFGCKVAIDDFGSGFSNMENILRLNPDIIKIDGSLIKNIHTSEKSKTIVKTMVTMSKELNAKTVAEYVHNEEVYEVVSSLGLDYLQGFYLQKPQKIN